MFKIVLFFISVLVGFHLDAASCQDWLKKLDFKDNETCNAECPTSPTDMSTFMCPSSCDKICKSLVKAAPKKVQNFYGLTDDEVKFCKENYVSCLKAYSLSLDAEKICLSIYPVSDVNDESDACRHYVWSLLLSRDIGEKDAERVLNAHENNELEPKQEQAMDLANNRLGLLNFQKNKKNFKTDEQIKNSFVEQIKNKKLIILKPYYDKSGGLP